MPSSAAPPSQSDASRSRPSIASSVSQQFPLDHPVSDLDEAVQKLRQRPPAEVRRARKHHRRALEALHDGAYDALDERTRKRLVERFHTNLKALNRALDETKTPDAPKAPEKSPQERESSSFRFQEVLTWLW